VKQKKCASSTKAEKDELTRQIGQLTIEVNWLKKKSTELYHAEERREMLDLANREIPLKKQAELLNV
jgi:putative transposase